MTNELIVNDLSGNDVEIDASTLKIDCLIGCPIAKLVCSPRGDYVAFGYTVKAKDPFQEAAIYERAKAN